MQITTESDWNQDVVLLGRNWKGNLAENVQRLAMVGIDVAIFDAAFESDDLTSVTSV